MMCEAKRVVLSMIINSAYKCFTLCVFNVKIKSKFGTNRAKLTPEVQLEQLGPALVRADFEQVKSALVGRQVNFLLDRAGL